MDREDRGRVVKSRFHKIFSITLIVLIVCTLSFTFTQSALSKEASTAVSEAVKDVIEVFLPSDTDAGEFVQENVRELAHFIEFAALGLFVSLYVALYMPAMGLSLCEKRYYVIASYVFAPIVALLDETIQIFSHRAPDILDVWLDTAGYASLATLSYLGFFTVALVKARRAKESLKDD